MEKNIYTFIIEHNFISMKATTLAAIVKNYIE